MSIAIRNVRRRFEAAPDSSPAGLLRQVELSMRAVGGAISPLYAAALSAVAIEVDGHAPGTPLTTALLRRCAEVAENAIRSLGHANPRHKTIVDAPLSRWSYAHRLALTPSSHRGTRHRPMVSDHRFHTT
jgi:hypothetical protein